MDYKQASVTGSAWHRFGRIVIENPYKQQPQVNCVEQEVIALASGDIVRDVNNLYFAFDPEASFEIVDPATNLGTGAFATGAQVYSLIYSYVMGEAKKRDAAVLAAATAAQEPTPTQEPTPVA